MSPGSRPTVHVLQPIATGVRRTAQESSVRGELQPCCFQVTGIVQQGAMTLYASTSLRDNDSAGAEG